MVSSKSEEEWVKFSGGQRAAEMVQEMLAQGHRGVDWWDVAIEPWDRVVEIGRRSFGDCAKILELACLGAGIRAKDEQCNEYSDLFDHEQSLVKRARYARLRAGAREWWSRQLDDAGDDQDLLLALLLFFGYAGSKTIEALIDKVDTVIRAMPEAEWKQL